MSADDYGPSTSPRPELPIVKRVVPTVAALRRVEREAHIPRAEREPFWFEEDA